MKRAIYDKQFKMAAVELVQSENCSVAKVANELNISGSSLQPWISEYEEYGESAFPGHGNALFNSIYEIKKLQTANEELKMENDLFKKTPGLLATKECVKF